MLSEATELMKPKIIWSSWFVPPKYTAWVIAPFIFFKTSREDTSDRLFRHELEHIYQVNRDGWLKFYVRYLWWSLRHGYWNNPYEVDARAAQDEPLNPVERHWKDNG